MSDTITTTPAARPVQPAPHAAFKGSEGFGTHLQQLLVDLLELAAQGKQAHWNVVGRNFRDLHLQLDEVVDAARGFSDSVAERMRAAWVTSDGRTSTVAATTTLAPFPAGEIGTATTVDLITAGLYAVAATARRIHDDVDAEDPTTADLIHEILGRLEQLAWMVDAENRQA